MDTLLQTVRMEWERMIIYSFVETQKIGNSIVLKPITGTVRDKKYRNESVGGCYS